MHDTGQGPRIYAGYTIEGTLDGGSDNTYGCVARWNGNGWEVIGGGLGPSGQYGSWASAIASYDSGTGAELYVGGKFNGSHTLVSPGIIRCDGSSWQSVGGGLDVPQWDTPYAELMTVYDGGHGPELIVAGPFGTAGGLSIPFLAKWNGTTWSSLGSGVNGRVIGMQVLDDGTGPKLYVSGIFNVAGGVNVSQIAIWDGTSWSAFPNPPVVPASAMLRYDDGRGSALFYAGTSNVGPTTAHFVSRWDGSQWSALGYGVVNDVFCMAAYDDGSGHGPDLYVGGQFINVGEYTQSINIGRWYRCAGPIDSICPGDQTLTACPCSNSGSHGHGCDNSAHTGGALMSSSGTLNPDALHFSISGELPHSLTILLQGDAPTTWTPTFGDGLRCTGGHLLRLYVTNAVNGVANFPGPGDPSITARSAAMGSPIPNGAVRLYQAYYRDPASLCGTGFNVSTGARIVWP